MLLVGGELRFDIELGGAGLDDVIPVAAQEVIDADANGAGTLVLFRDFEREVTRTGLLDESRVTESG